MVSIARPATNPQIEYDGQLFTRDSKTGYFLSSQPVLNGKRTRLHRYVWYCHNGEIPSGFVVHHIDGDKNNNGIENLKLMPVGRHASIHVQMDIIANPGARRERFIKNAHPAAKKWHKSKEGHDWHKRQFEVSLRKCVSEKIIKTCEVCGKKYEVPLSNARKSRFCSKKCKAKYRRDNKIDHITKECVVCGETFSSNRYDKTITCSRRCAAQIIVAKREERLWQR